MEQQAKKVKMVGQFDSAPDLLLQLVALKPKKENGDCKRTLTFIFKRLKYSHAAESELKEHVEKELLRYFEINRLSDNILSGTDSKWLRLLDDKWNTHFLIITLHILTFLVRSSIPNRQKISEFSQFKSSLQRYLSTQNRGCITLRRQFQELYGLILSVNCKPNDLVDIYRHVANDTKFAILEQLEHFMRDPLSQSYLDFESAYKQIPLPSNANGKFSIQVFLSPSNVEHNRILTLGTGIHFEIIDGSLCIFKENDRLTTSDKLKLRENTLYLITIEFDMKEITIYVNDISVTTSPISKGRLSIFQSFTIGSNACSFRLYRLRVWSVNLPLGVIQATYKLGSTYQNCFQTPYELSGISVDTRDALLQEIYRSNNDLKETSYEEFLRGMSVWKAHLLFYDLDISNEIESQKAGNFKLKFNHDSDALESAGCYYFKLSDFPSLFQAINFVSYVYYGIQHSDTMTEVFNYTQHLINMLQCDVVRVWFESEYSYAMLGQLLKFAIGRFKQGLPIQFLNLFLAYCGWSSDDIPSSIIKNEQAHKCLILDGDLWNTTISKRSMDPESIEILRYIYFHLASLVEDSNYAKFNLEKLKPAKLLRKISYYLHLRSAIHFERLREDISKLYVSLLKLSEKGNDCHWLVNLTYFELQNIDMENSETNLTALNTLLFDMPNENSLSHASLLCEQPPMGELLIILTELITRHLNPLTCLNIIIMLLCSNKAVFHNFAGREGLSLLLSILKELDKKYFRAVLHQLYATAFNQAGEFVAGSPNFEAARTWNKRSSACNIEFLYLAIRLLEDYVLQSSPEDTPAMDSEICLFLKYLQDQSFLANRKDNPSADLQKPENTRLILLLFDLYLSLRESSVSVEYKNATSSLENLIFGCIEGGIMNLKKTEFEAFITTLFLPADDLYIPDRSLRKRNNYLVIAIPDFITRVVLKRFSLDDETLRSLQTSKPHFFENMTTLLRTMTGPSAESVLDSSSLSTIFDFLFTCSNIFYAYLESSPTNFTKTSFTALLTFFLSILVTSSSNGQIIWDHDELERFCRKFLSSKMSLLNMQYGFCDVKLLCMFLWYFMTISKVRGYSKPVIDCVTSILLFRENDLEAISETLSLSNKSFLLAKLRACLASDSDATMTNLISIYDKLSSGGLSTFLETLSKQNEDNFDTASQSGSGRQLVTKKINERMKFHRITRSKHESNIYMSFIDNSLNTKRRIMAHIGREFHNYKIDRKEVLLRQLNDIDGILRSHKYLMDVLDGDTSQSCWKLDSSEDMNRIRRRLVPAESSDEELKDQYPDIKDSLKRSSFNLALGNIVNDNFSNDTEFEVVRYHELLGDSENRRIFNVLEENDVLKNIWNCCFIVGLEIREGILILGTRYLYFVANCYFSKKERKVLSLFEVPIEKRDLTIGLLSNNQLDTLGLRTEANDVDRWALNTLSFITRRSFLLRDVAMEILFDGNTSSFFSFRSPDLRNRVFSVLSKLCQAGNSDPVFSDILEEINKHSDLIGTRNGISKGSIAAKLVNTLRPTLYYDSELNVTTMWKNGKISNFYYLMILNALAGRSLNDITQYPVFPWILSDYKSARLDLNDPTSYRDLQRPMGAQSEERRQKFVERYEALASLNDKESPPFHYGTHYSSSMIVASYLIRIKPFTEAFLELQGGSFGPPDRLFNSIERAWSSAAIENTTDVRELTPEFFAAPEFLINLNKEDFGTLQDGSSVNDVILPPWAHNDPMIFIARNREALESPYVSQNLHKWIDLIFGYKQRGEEAVQSVNVFSKQSYHGAFNLDDIEDENERRTFVGVIHNFGQTPLQIFQKPHPKKVVLNNFKISDATWNRIDEAPSDSHIRPMVGKRVYMTDWNPCDGTSFPKSKAYPFLDIEVGGKNDRISITLVGKTSLAVNGQLFRNIHLNGVTAFSLWRKWMFFTGDRHGRIVLWRVFSFKGIVKLHPVRTFYGHLSTIISLKVNKNYNTLVSVDTSGTALTWDILSGHIIRPLTGYTSTIAISELRGTIAVGTNEGTLRILNINGLEYLSKPVRPGRIITCMEFLGYRANKSETVHAHIGNFEVLLAGYADGSIRIFELLINDNGEWDLRPVKSLRSGKHAEITYLKGFADVNRDNSKSDELINVEVVAGNGVGDTYLWKSQISRSFDQIMSKGLETISRNFPSIL